MKRHFSLFAVVVIMLAAFFACSKQSSAPAGIDAAALAARTEEPVAKGDTAFIIAHGISLWDEKGGEVVWKKSATIGDKVQVLGNPDKLKYKGKESDYSPIQMADGSKYYVRTPYVIKADRLAVVRDEKCIQYNEPRVTGASKTIVPRLTVVAIVDPSMQDVFMKVSYANLDSSVVVDKWIKRESFVDSAVDVQSAIALNVVALTKDKDLKINILLGASSSYSGSVFVDDINNLLLELQGAPVVTLVPEVASFTINAADVNVRSSPSADSQSLGKLNTGDIVETSERTTEKVEIKGLSDYWYHITSPVDGWVFGALFDK